MKIRYLALAIILLITKIAPTKAAFVHPEKTLGEDDSAYNVIDEILHATPYNVSFVYHEVDADGSFFPTTYQYSYTLKSGIISEGRMADTSGMNNIVGNFIEQSFSGGNGGAIYNNLNKDSITGNFIGNSALYWGGAIVNLDKSIITNVKADFIGNTSGLNGGAIGNDGTIVNLAGNFITNKSESFGGAVYNYGTIENINGYFIGNRAYNSGGAIFHNQGIIRSISAEFIGNSTEQEGGAIGVSDGIVSSISSIFIANSAKEEGGAIYNARGTIENATGTFIGNKAGSGGGAIYSFAGKTSFNTTEAGQSILFENNHITDYKPRGYWLNSIHLDRNSTVNFNLVAGSFANIRDPISGDDVNSAFNKTGTGSLYLWGKNNEYSGRFNVKEGSLYAMFEENRTIRQMSNDPNTQRGSFNMNSAKITFEDGTFFRPQMYNSHDRLAQLTNNSSNLTINGTAYLLPYNISSLDVGSYVFNNNYTGFSGWESNLASLSTDSGSVNLEIKSDLNGYQGLNDLADIYRKRSDLSLMEREVLDDIYFSGLVPDAFRDMFGIIGGEDYETFEQIHRASVRQYNRQVVSRVDNKNCTACGRNAGYSDEHLWFNVSHNRIKKDRTRRRLGYEYNPNGFAFGFDHDFIPKELSMGLAFSYAGGTVKNKTVPGIRSRNETDEYLMSFYGKYQPTRPYISWNLGGGLIENKPSLITAVTNTRGNYDTYVFFANMETGYELGRGDYEVISPYIGLEYTHIFSEGYNERGIGARHFDRMDWDIFEVPIGIKLSRDLFYEDYIFTPAVDLAYARNFGDTGSSTTTAFVGNRADSWRISSSSDKKDSLRANLNFKINNSIVPLALNLGYSIDYRSDYTDQQVYGTIRWDF